MAHTRELLLMVGESGSGKSTIAKKLVEEKGYVRVNLDELRVELANDPEGKNLKGRAFEEFVKKVQMSRVGAALAEDKNVVVDNTNLHESTVNKWIGFANHKASFRIYCLTTPLAECISRDAGRDGKARVGRAVIERQFLDSKRLPISAERKYVLVDVDGTLADHNGIRSPYDESKVGLDKAYLDIISTVNGSAIQEDFDVLVVSGRHSTCGDSTVEWLKKYGLNFQHIFMRHGWDNRSDVIVKQEILNSLLAMIPKENILRVVDDRRRVIDMWLANGLEVTCVKHGQVCTYDETLDF